MRGVVICSAGSRLNREVMPAFAATALELVGIVEVEYRLGSTLARLEGEWRRSRVGVVDVLAFRIYDRLRLTRRDRAWLRRYVAELLSELPPLPDVPTHVTQDANSESTKSFLESLEPDICIAACKTILRREIFDIPRHGTFVVHPGICPEYRNSHGAFWALARRDLDRVGATLLRIDEGVDTGPVFAYYTTPYDERYDSHVVIQSRLVYDNLAAIGSDLRRVVEGDLHEIDVTGRVSAAWGQPRLTSYLRWRRAVRRGSSGGRTRTSSRRSGRSGSR